ncbi:hypothetical protein P3H15_01445 [Rhodococcus sp. T2V]|uniref:hypothetical protein n=1 Tax=Rhodococcus sp. T2V TaxID=3034164 RepID=UPI0023E20F73|nr:hypothetical protein [Rhodococcus sp. T2V]MDF3303671.1 hypothetical protein [Rhodococcus sp. T2V]
MFARSESGDRERDAVAEPGEVVRDTQPDPVAAPIGDEDPAGGECAPADPRTGTRTTDLTAAAIGAV